MKKALMSIAMMAVAALGVVACGEKTGAQEAGQQTEAAEAAVPDGFKTHEFAHFTISLPEEFTTTGEQDYGGTTTVRFDSEAPLKLENGEETTSSATIDCGFMSDGAKPANIKETAATMKASQEAAGETCDEPKIDGNVILMRHFHELDEGDKGVTWRWWIVSESGANVSGNIFFPESQAKVYEPLVEQIVKSIKLK